MRRKAWKAVDSWAYVKDDATERNIEDSKYTMKLNHPTARVRTFKRTVRAGGAVIPIVAIVAQVAVPQVPSTVGYVVVSRWANPDESFDVFATPSAQVAADVRDGLNRTSRGGSWRGASALAVRTDSPRYRNALSAIPAEDIQALAERAGQRSGGAE